MRALFLVPLLSVFLLTGCGSLFRHNGDDFEAAGADPLRFEADEQACTVVAGERTSYDVMGMDGTGYDRNRVFNDVYSRCMTGRGYVPRPYSKNWLPQG